MFKKHTNIIPIEKLLNDIQGLDGNGEVKQALERFIINNMAMSDGILIVWTHGKRVDIDGTKFSEVEAVWAMEKAKHELLNKGLSFND